MKIVLDLKKIYQEYERTAVYFIAHCAFLFLLQFNKITNSGITLKALVTVIFWILVYRSFYLVKKNIQYTYWTFFTLLQIYFLQYFLTPVSIIDSYIALFAMVALGMEGYVLSSPIYYPRISWWEYDFRYKDDLKISLSFNEKSYKARLTDLRREAGCVACFEEFSPGDNFEVNYSSSTESLSLRAEIMSKRQYSLGRPFTYGVKFHFEDKDARKNYRKLMRFWRSEKSFKRKLKAVESNH